MRFKLMTFVAATVLTVPAIGQTTGSAVPPPKPKKEKKICRSAEANSYSRMAPVVCRTKAEWDRNPTVGKDGDAGVRSIGGDGVTTP